MVSPSIDEMMEQELATWQRDDDDQMAWVCWRDKRTEPFSAYGKWAQEHLLYKSDIEDYEAEVERRRQIGLTIDPATAETMFWYADVIDPYCLLAEKYHAGCVGRERFARNPGGEWVDFADLPEATCKALWDRDGRKLSFPYGLHPDDDVINYPPPSK